MPILTYVTNILLRAAPRSCRLLPLLLALTAAQAVAQPRTERDRTLAAAVQQAAILAGQGNYNRAIGQLQNALDSAAVTSADDAARPDALFTLSQLSLTTHRFSLCYSTCCTFLREYPNERRADDALYSMAVSAYEQNRHDEAGRVFRRVLERCDSSYIPNFVEDAHKNTLADWSNYWIARISAEQGRSDTAEAYAWKAVAYKGKLPLFIDHRFTPEATFLLGWLLEKRRQFDTAGIMYQRVLEYYSGSSVAPDARLRKAVLLAHKGEFRTALQILKDISPVTNGQREEQLYYLGEISSSLGLWNDAATYCTQYLAQFPGSQRTRQVRYNLGWAQRMLGRNDEAVGTFRQLELVNDSLTASAYYQIGAIQMARGDTVGALGTFQTLVHKLPYESFSDDAFYQIGRIHYRRGSYDSAAYYTLIVARQFPESDLKDDAYYLLGESYMSVNDNANAQVAFTRATKYAGTPELRARATYREAIALYKLGRFHSAISRLRDYTAQFPNGAQADDATFWLGEALYQDRTYPEAERYYAVLLEKYAASRWHPEAQFGLAWSQMQQKKFSKAAESFNKFIADNPGNPFVLDATLALASAYRYSGRYEDAIKTLESVGSASGMRSEEAKARLAEVLLDMKQVDRAVDVYRGLIETYPKSPLREHYAFNIGQIYRDAGRDSVAVLELKNFVVTFPASELAPVALFTIGDAYYNMPQFDSAVSYYRRVLDEHPNSDVVPEALDAVRYALEGAGRGSEAIALIDSFQQKNPDRLPADSLAFRKSTILFEQAEYVKAIGVNRKTLTDYPTTTLRPDILFQMAKGYERVARNDSAGTLYTEIIDKHDSSRTVAEHALIARAGLRLKTSNLPDAVRDLRLFVQKYPQSEQISEAHYLLGLTSIVLKDTSTALEEFNASIVSSKQIASDSAKDEGDELSADRSRLAIAKILVSRKQTDSALTVLAPVFSRRLDDIAAEALLLHADLSTQVGDLDGALADLKKLTTDFPDFPEFAEPGMLMLGKLYERQNEKAAARDLYSKLIASTKDAKRRKDAEARLRRLR